MSWRASLALIVVLATVGCAGGSGDTSTATFGPTPTPTTTPMPEPTATATPEPACSTDEGELVVDLFHDYLVEWDDITALASSTPRIQLSVHISDLQRIRREVEDQEWPECAAEAQRLAVRYMNKVIDAFTAFLGGSESQADTYIDTANNYLDEFVAELGRLDIDPT